MGRNVHLAVVAGVRDAFLTLLYAKKVPRQGFLLHIRQSLTHLIIIIWDVL